MKPILSDERIEEIANIFSYADDYGDIYLDYDDGIKAIKQALSEFLDALIEGDWPEYIFLDDAPDSVNLVMRDSYDGDVNTAKAMLKQMRDDNET